MQKSPSAWTGHTGVTRGVRGVLLGFRDSRACCPCLNHATLQPLFVPALKHLFSEQCVLSRMKQCGHCALGAYSAGREAVVCVLRHYP